MRIRFIMTAVAAAGLLSLSAVPATAAAGDAGQPADGTGQECASVRLSGSLPAPPPGMAVEQRVTIGTDCAPHLGPARLVAAAGTDAADRTVAPAAGVRQLESWSEMYDCCNIRMTGLYTTSSWEADGHRVVTASTTARQEWNREPWDAGWSLESSGKTADCVSDCAASHNEARAAFSYKGIFDATGDWYANEHRSFVDLNADGTASCRFEVDLKHTFVGWNLRRGCS
ncbi:hypothetical protein AB0L33_27615 [Streptomyces sp. NPDC052299]|uniref:hypothetical protein n=1 Tax=Streptomyces sp. NPDC052299 TaxID=3155054 RepID=UPI00341DF8B9